MNWIRHKATYKKQVLLDFSNLLKIIDIILYKKINENNINRHQITRNSKDKTTYLILDKDLTNFFYFIVIYIYLDKVIIT
jgi:hypothetical protein